MRGWFVIGFPAWYTGRGANPAITISQCDIMSGMRRKHRRTLEAIFRRPTQASINWSDIESLFVACGAAIEERAGSRVEVELNGVLAVFHRPHPRKEADKGSVASVRRFLAGAGVKP